MPKIDHLLVHKTKYYQFRAIFENEGIISRTMKVYNNIFLKQLGLKEIEDFSHTLSVTDPESGPRWACRKVQLRLF